MYPLSVCGLFFLGPSVGAMRVGTEVADLQRVPVTYPGQASHDHLANIEPPPPLPDWKLRRNRASMSYLYWGVQSMAADNYTQFYCEHSEDGCRTYDAATDHVELTFDVCVEELPKTLEREVRGEVVRMGDLGGFIFNHLVWEDDWKQFPIGTSDVALHRVARPVGDSLMGRGSPVWSSEILRAFAEEFFETHRTINKEDLDLWTHKVFHKIFFDMDLTDQDAADFEGYKNDLITVGILPTWLASTFRWNLGLSSLRERREQWLDRYVEAIQNDQRGVYAQFELEGRDLRFVADFYLTAFSTAGGLSVPATLNHVLALVHGAAPVNLTGADRVLTERNLEQFILETVRFFPLVLGFPMWDPEINNRTVYSVGQAIRDPRAWDDPMTFKLRPLSEYHKPAGTATKIGLAWAAQARGYDGLTPDSRGCPAQDLSMVMATEFFKVYMRSQAEWSVLYQEERGLYIGDNSQANNFTISRGGALPPGHRPQVVRMTTPAPETEDEAVAMGRSLSWFR